jgi:hypothetical protein
MISDSIGPISASSSFGQNQSHQKVHFSLSDQTDGGKNILLLPCPGTEIRLELEEYIAFVTPWRE